MKLKLENEENGKWYEFLLGWKWPHQGFTIGYDFVQPNEQPEENETTYYAFIIYLGPLAIIYNWGNHNWDE